jgi:hypothetical protein
MVAGESHERPLGELRGQHQHDLPTGRQHPNEPRCSAGEVGMASRLPGKTVSPYDTSRPPQGIASALLPDSHRQRAPNCVCERPDQDAASACWTSTRPIRRRDRAPTASVTTARLALEAHGFGETSHHMWPRDPHSPTSARKRPPRRWRSTSSRHRLATRATASTTSSSRRSPAASCASSSS